MATIAMQTMPEPPLELTLPAQPLQLSDLQVLAPLGKVHGNTLILERGLKGYRLKKPVDVDLDKLLSIGEKGLCEYIVKAFIGQRPSLIPWVLDNLSLIALGRYLLRSRSGSLMGMFGYTNTVQLYSKRLNRTPDAIIADIKPHGIHVDRDRVGNHRKFLERCIAEMQDRSPPISPGRISGYVRQIRTWYQTNGVEIPKPQLPRVRIVRKDRAPSQDELQKLIDVADLRGRVIIYLLALCGFREGTLVLLQYRHVRKDLEAHIVPIHIHIDADETKGRYADFDTFGNQEVADCLNLYFEARRRGTPPQWKHGQQVEYMPPEQITDDSPLIRDSVSPVPRPVGEKQIYKLVHSLYQRAGLLTRGKHGGYDLRPHSIRKFFKTQMKTLKVGDDYIDYMMGHVIDTYHDVQSKGVEFLRNIYAKASLAIRPQSKLSKLDIMKEFARAQGLDPEKILVEKAFSEPMMAYVDPRQRELEDVEHLSKAVMQRFRQELSKAPLES
jgi:integrase